MDSDNDNNNNNNNNNNNHNDDEDEDEINNNMNTSNEDSKSNNRPLTPASPIPAIATPSVIQSCIEYLGKTLQCAICLNLCVSPVSLPCSHYYCELCVSEIFAANNKQDNNNNTNLNAQYINCPVCRHTT